MKTSGDLAASLGVHRQRLHRWIGRGILASSRTTDGGHRRFTPADERRARIILALERAGIRKGRRFDRAVHELAVEVEAMIAATFAAPR